MTAELLGDYGKLPQPTLISGRFILSRDFVYGRFTEVQLPNGQKLPVCLEAFSGGDVRLGIKIIPGGTPKNPHIHSSFSVLPVSRFH